VLYLDRPPDDHPPPGIVQHSLQGKISVKPVASMDLNDCIGYFNGQLN